MDTSTLNQSLFTFNASRPMPTQPKTVGHVKNQYMVQNLNDRVKPAVVTTAKLNNSNVRMSMLQPMGRPSIDPRANQKYKSVISGGAIQKSVLQRPPKVHYGVARSRPVEMRYRPQDTWLPMFKYRDPKYELFQPEKWRNRTSRFRILDDDFFKDFDQMQREMERDFNQMQKRYQKGERPQGNTRYRAEFHSYRSPGYGDQPYNYQYYEYSDDGNGPKTRSFQDDGRGNVRRFGGDGRGNIPRFLGNGDGPIDVQAYEGGNDGPVDAVKRGARSGLSMLQKGVNSAYTKSQDLLQSGKQKYQNFRNRGSQNYDQGHSWPQNYDQRQWPQNNYNQRYDV